MAPGFIRPAALLHQVGILIRIQRLVFCQVRLQLLRGPDRILVRIPADLCRSRFVHDQTGGNAQFLVGGNAVYLSVILHAFEEIRRQAGQDIPAVIVQQVPQRYQLSRLDLLHIAFPVRGKDQVDLFVIQQRADRLLRPGRIPGNQMEGNLHVGLHLPAFIQFGKISVDRFLHPGADRRVILVRNPVDIQRIGRFRRGGGDQPGQHHQANRQINRKISQVRSEVFHYVLHCFIPPSAASLFYCNRFSSKLQ